MSRVRLREQEGRAAELAEAQSCLRDVYARSTAGLSLPDLKEAAALLSETHPPL